MWMPKDRFIYSTTQNNICWTLFCAKQCAKLWVMCEGF